MSNDWTDRTVTVVVAVLLEELHYRDTVLQNDQLSLVVATYVSQWKHLSLAGESTEKTRRPLHYKMNTLRRKSQLGPRCLQSLSPILTIRF